MHEDPLRLIPNDMRAEIGVHIEGDLNPEARWLLEHVYDGDIGKVLVERIFFSISEGRGFGTFVATDPRSENLRRLVGEVDMSALDPADPSSARRGFLFDGELNAAHRGMSDLIEIFKMDERFLAAADRILACKGMLVVTGMGKAGLIGAKISATFASTGTPSLALHPVEALHGDLGRLREKDVVLVLSNSGETAEITALIPRVRQIGAGVIAMTGQPDSTLGSLADCVLDIGRVDEACPLGLAPTASTSAMLALGDALAMVVQTERGFSREDYARFHPSGSLGRSLMRVSEAMRTGDELPLAPAGTRVIDVLLTMSLTKGRPGAAIVVDKVLPRNVTSSFILR